MPQCQPEKFSNNHFLSQPSLLYLFHQAVISFLLSLNYSPAMWMVVYSRSQCSRITPVTFLIVACFSLLTGNDLEALWIHLCVLASDCTIEGQPSLEVPLVPVARKPLPQQTKGKKEKTYTIFYKETNLLPKTVSVLLRGSVGKWSDRQALSGFSRDLIFLLPDFVTQFCTAFKIAVDQLVGSGF